MPVLVMVAAFCRLIAPVNADLVSDRGHGGRNVEVTLDQLRRDAPGASFGGTTPPVNLAGRGVGEHAGVAAGVEVFRWSVRGAVAID